jgi:hypothetical protein|tara:strand:+ start:1007 stop:1231 length:225 start_codon:yes stop_codon:yes gene_type:complete
MSNLVDALISKYKGEVQVAQANIDGFLNQPVGVADHPDMADTLDGLVKKLNSAQEQLSTLQSLKEVKDKEFIVE